MSGKHPVFQKKLLVVHEGHSEQNIVKALCKLYGYDGIVPKFLNVGGGSPTILVKRAHSTIRDSANSYSRCLIIGDDDKVWPSVKPVYKGVHVTCVRPQRCLEVMLLTMVNKCNAECKKSSKRAKQEFELVFGAKAHEADITLLVSRVTCEEKRVVLPELDRLLRFFSL